MKTQSQNREKEIVHAQNLINLILQQERIEKQQLEYLFENIIIHSNGAVTVNLREEIKHIYKIEEDDSNNVVLLDKHRKMLDEQEHIEHVFIAINYLAKIYEILIK